MEEQVYKYYKKWSENCRVYIDYKPIHSHEDFLKFAEDYHNAQKEVCYLKGFIDGYGGEEPRDDFPEGFDNINQVWDRYYELIGTKRN